MPRAVRSVVIANAHILVADDDLGLLEAVALAFEHLGAHVVRARSGAELMDHIAEDGPFDLVVTDVAMPWMTGLQAMHSARCAGMQTPVIVMTALKHERVATQVGALGDNAALLRKPFAMDELERVATRLLSSTPNIAEQSPAP